MNINLDFDSDEKCLWKPHIWKKFYHNQFEQKYYNSRAYISIVWLWFDFDMTLPYKEKGNGKI